MSGADPRGFLVRFRDGPLAGKGNIGATGSDVFNVSSDVWDWPLPNRLAVLTYPEHTNQVAMWDADGDGMGLPAIIWQSPNAVVYVKLSESKLPHGAEHVARGAEYGLEKVRR